MKLTKYLSSEPINYFNTDKQVFKGMWVSNVVNFDLPTVEDIKLYEEKVIEMLDTCLEYNINAIFFQVRTTNDAFYESELNPYSRFFTGKEGKKPPYDVMKWIIEETKKRNIEFHAWCNPYRVSFDGKLSVEDYLATCDDLNFAKKHPEYLVLDNSGKLILNPGIQEVKDFIVDSMVEIVEKYDVDGIHFDDYFYPYNGLSEANDDKEQFENQSLSLGDFRRKNVNDIIEGIFHAIKKVNSKVRFGISPFGIWKNNKENEFGSNTGLGCTESYYGLYADTLAWINGEYIDYVIPQIYWEFGHKIAPFADICDFWVNVCKDKKVDLYIGHGAYRLGNDGEFQNPNEVTNQIKYTSQFPVVLGNVFFTYKNFIEKGKGYLGMQEIKKLYNGEKT
jgi:uncharacterized lipoprotein YddW (UPF0748 family)